MDPIELVAQLSMGLALAGAAGIRAFFPLAAISLLARADMLSLTGSWEFLGSDAALIVLGTATVLELLGDKLPVVDHLLDATGVLVKPVAGAIASTAIVTNIDPVLGMTVGMVGGAGFAGGVHAIKAAVRGVSTMTTGGLANPLVSLTEDGVTLGAVGLAVFLPLLAFALLLGLLVGGGVWLLRRRRNAAAREAVVSSAAG